LRRWNHLRAGDPAHTQETYTQKDGRGPPLPYSNTNCLQPNLRRSRIMG
jgi:hypothetical protein